MPDPTTLDGATDPGDPAAWPADAGQFAARWNAADIDRRNALVRRFMENHYERLAARPDAPTPTPADPIPADPLVALQDARRTRQAREWAARHPERTEPLALTPTPAGDDQREVLARTMAAADDNPCFGPGTDGATADAWAPYRLRYYRMADALLAARPSAPTVTTEQALASHQRRGMGMSWGSPDTCACGARVLPEAGDDEVSLRRDRAFAAHQVAALGIEVTP